MRRLSILFFVSLPFIGGAIARNGSSAENHTQVRVVAQTEPQVVKYDEVEKLSITPDKPADKQTENNKRPVRTNGQTQRPAPTAVNGNQNGQDGERKVVDFEADIMKPIQVGDSTALNLLGNVVFYHNGAVITCDSAVRYSEKRMECFRRVVINQKTTYIYGDRADYNGELNEARVYAPIVKMVDEDATLYTYNFSFNTLDKIGTYSGGATMSQNDNLMESQRGYYYVDLRELVAVDEVELKNPDYQLISDSVAYNMDTEVATFFTKTYIWNSKGEILSADKGSYASTTADYEFTENAYIITKTQEVWADSIDYNSETENAILRNNIQTRDEEQKVMGFGDYGQYWGQEQNGLLTRDPSLINFDPEQPDTLYMRADSMFFYTFDREMVFETIKPDEASQSKTAGDGGEKIIIPKSSEPVDSLIPPAFDGVDAPADSLSSAAAKGKSRSGLSHGGITGAAGAAGIATSQAETGENEAEQETTSPDSLDRIVVAPENVDAWLEDSKQNMREQEKQIKADKKASKREAKDRAKAQKQVGNVEKHDHDHDHGDHGHDNAGTFASTGIEGADIDTLADADSSSISELLPVIQDDAQVQPDSLSTQIQIPADSLAADSTQQDSLQRVVYGYHNVRIYRSDFQAVCDSLMGFSIDSTLHLYIDPVLWNNVNQITSDIMDIYTKNQQLDKAVFRGSPFMCSQVDSTMYNQIKGKQMEALFKNNDIYRNDVNGNGQTHYYMEDDKTKELMGFLVAECADITFLIEEMQMDKIIYRGSPVYSIYPMDKIPASQDQFLPGFKWEGERRPKLSDVFSRRIRPSEREMHESMVQPIFPLTDKIFEDKDRKIKERIWTERNDKLSGEAQEFIRSITRE